MRIGVNLPNSGQRHHDPDATALTGSPNAKADRIRQYRGCGC
jgi:hypothetical protein